MRRLPLSLAISLCVSGFLIGPPSSASALPALVGPVAASPGTPSAAKKLFSDKAVVDTKSYEDVKGPDAFAVAGSRVYLDNPLNGTIRTYSSGKYKGALKLSGVASIDLQASGRALTVLDNANTIRTYNVKSATKAVLARKEKLALGRKPPGLTMSAAEAKSLGLSAMSGQALSMPITVDRISNIDGNLVAELSSGASATVFKPKLSAASNKASVEHFAKVSGGFNVLDRAGSVLKKIRLPYTPETIETLYRGGGYDYYHVCDSYADTSDAGVFNGYVFKFTTGGTPAGVYTLKNSKTYGPNREVQVSGGQVYQLLVDGGKAQVLRLAPDTGKFVRAKNFAALTSYPSTPITTSSLTTQAAKTPRAIKLRAALMTSQALAITKWKYSKANNGKVPKGYASKVKAPYYISNLKTKTATFYGLPYTWGGWDTTSTSSEPTLWRNFAGGLKKKKYVGNVSNKSPGRVPNTIGVDCSGLISAAFSLPEKHGTSNLVGKYFTAVKGFSPQYGDILIKPGHVMLYFGKDPEKTKDTGEKWIVGEATTGKYADKVMYWTRNQRDLTAQGYKVARYR